MNNLTLLTDLYQLTMAKGYFENNMLEDEAVFHLFFRKNPFNGNYTISCGLNLVIEFIENFHFSTDDIQYLASLKSNAGSNLFDESFLNYLQRLKFQCDIDALPEGTIVFPHEPMIRVKGPLIQAQLIESALLNLVNFSSLIATKSSRIVQAAKDDDVLEFGLRRAQGPNGAVIASRSAYIGGCVGTSNLLAGKLYNIPVIGTHAHSWIMCFDHELDAFEAYSNSFPDQCVFLVDTYDTIKGVENAIKIGKSLKEKGHQLMGIRLDSGDLNNLSQKARKLLDQEGFNSTKIVASNDLDEFKIEQLKKLGAKINAWGVGTRLSTSYDQPALGGVYKIAALKKKNSDWKYKIKLSEDPIKISNPGILNILRYENENKLEQDIIVNELDASDYQEIIINKKAKLLLEPIFRSGVKVYDSPNIHDIKKYTKQQLKKVSSLKNFKVELSSKLNQLKMDLKNSKN